MDKTLITQENINPIEVFVDNGLSSILLSIEEKARSFVPDLSTDKSRKEIATLCYKIKRSKTYIESLKKEYVGELKKQPKIVDREGKRARDFLDALEEDIRDPLTRWEADEKERIDSILKRVNDIDPFKGGIISILVGDMSTDDLKSMLSTATEFVIDDSLMEMEEMGRLRREEVILKLSGLLSMQEKAEAEKAELARLQAEAAERKQQERIDLAAKEAKEKAEKEAATQAEAERLREAKEKQAAADAIALVEKQKIEAEEKAKRDAETAKQAEIQAKIDSEKREKDLKEQAKRDIEAAKLSELQAKANAVQREKDLKEKAKRDIEQAVKDEQERVLKQQNADKVAADKRAADKRNCAKINNQCIKDLIKIGLNKEQAKDVVIALAKGIISNASIKY